MTTLRPLSAVRPSLSPSLSPAQTGRVLHATTPGKTLRSLSISSASSSASNSSTSSTYSRAAEDMLDRFVAQPKGTSIRLWSAGNAAIGTPSLHLTMDPKEVSELVAVMQADDRFQMLHLVHLDEEQEEWSVAFRRTPVVTTPPLSDTE